MDGSLLKSVFHDDALDDDGRFNGSDHTFADMVMSILPKMHFIAHYIMNVLIQFQDDSAHVESYFMAIQIGADQKTQETCMAATSIVSSGAPSGRSRNAFWCWIGRGVDPAAARWPHEHQFTRGRRDRSDAAYQQ